MFAFGDSVFHSHAGFSIDWGDNPPTGIQDPPGHRDNILAPHWTETGVGIRTGGHFGVYWVQMFGLPF